MNQSPDLSGDEDYIAGAYRVNPRSFYEKRWTSRRAYVFDLGRVDDYEASHLPGLHDFIIEQLEDSIYRMPFPGDILLYGSDGREVLTTGEILYDKGFGKFHFVDSYESLFQDIDESFVKAGPKAHWRI